MPNFTCNLTPAPCNMAPPAARHYHSSLSIWLSMDPMSDKYPSTSPYTYCANNPVRLVDPNGRDVVNPYTAKVEETQNIISKIEQMIKEGNCDVGLARAAKRYQMSELREYKNLERKANFAIAALQENGQFDILNNLKDEHGNTIDVYITYNNNLPSTREAQCNISALVQYERDQNGNITNVHFLGFNSNRVYIELSGRNDALNVCHEGGHLEYEVPTYGKYLLWQIQNGCYYDGYNGHLKNKEGETIDPSGIRAEQRENDYRKRHP